ncbi:MAG: thioredoxin family protein [Planctomycetaceae bacterium]|jgi:thiol:disulfide interchange protein|nr:thioredoxin family protein [Planctomycetaceae bacterium]MBN8601919.1 thioredoxin family protein [Planctomycetota bacterium]
MGSWVLALMVAVTGNGGDAESSYAKAYHRAQEENKPLVVLVGADWCPACQVMKADTIEPMKKEGLLEDVVFAHVDRDADPELASKLMGTATTLPQLVVYTKGESGWKRTAVSGLQSRGRVRDVIRKAMDALPLPRK